MDVNLAGLLTSGDLNKFPLELDIAKIPEVKYAATLGDGAVAVAEVGRVS